MKGWSENHTVDILAQIFAETEVHVRTFCWIARVSSYSNIADAPSRGDANLLKQLNFSDVSADATDHLRLLFSSMVAKLGKMAERSKPNG